MNSTIIKCPGGKINEYKYIKDIIPNYNRYAEPFFSRGGIFFQKELRDILHDFVFFDPPMTPIFLHTGAIPLTVKIRKD